MCYFIRQYPFTYSFIPERKKYCFCKQDPQRNQGQLRGKPSQKDDHALGKGFIYGQGQNFREKEARQQEKGKRQYCNIIRYKDCSEAE